MARAPPSVASGRRGKYPARPEYEEREQEQHEIEIALRDAAEVLEDVLEAADNETGDDRTWNAAEPADHRHDQPLDGQRQRQQRREHADGRSSHRAGNAAEHASDDECEDIYARGTDSAE